jgi:hypothetical protein
MPSDALVLCPICGTSARAVADAEVHYVCGVCGAPTLGAAPQVGHFEVSSRDDDQLRELVQLRKSAGIQSWGALGVLVCGLMMMSVTLVAFMMQWWQAWIAFGLSIGQATMWLLIRNRLQSTRKRVVATRDDLWQRAALALIRERGSLTAPALAETYGVPTATAEEWLQTLTTTTGVELSDPTAGGEPQYTWTGAAAVKLRVDTTQASSSTQLPPEVDAELREFDAQLAAETAANERRKMQEHR